MNRDDVIRMAIQCQLVTTANREGIFMDALDRFAQLVAAKEREACAKLCEEAQTYSMPISCPDGISGCLVAHYIPARREKTGSEAAAAIRARGEA